MALDYFEPCLMDDLDQDFTWLNDYDGFIEELMINFGTMTKSLMLKLNSNN